MEARAALELPLTNTSEKALQFCQARVFHGRWPLESEATRLHGVWGRLAFISFDTVRQLQMTLCYRRCTSKGPRSSKQLEGIFWCAPCPAEHVTREPVFLEMMRCQI